MNATNGIGYIVIYVEGMAQSIARGWIPTRYLVLLSGSEAGTVVPVDMR